MLFLEYARTKLELGETTLIDLNEIHWMIDYYISTL